ncbi:hypothetical protein VXS02_14505 [Photobacterium piscicola]|uniref:Uncharacterized protein n=1 Tax=Photobacterium piscicola TaxID=1378299 RepID=A0ABU6LH57_9GAMM|nr:hypothetical protein [Photobacterium piscicola]MEC6882747.1 hypothetical protein [Photobacterium piscicola]MEC6898675.1 hypothetical protein [Photobacterium piscicola]
MTYWKNLHLTNQTITGLSLSINVVYPPEFESNIHNELQHLKTIYQCSQLFKKEVLSIICAYDGRLVSFTQH